MSWSYSGNPLASPKDEIRFLIGDVDSSDPLIQDEEIAYTLTLTYGIGATPPPMKNYLPAARCAEEIASRFSRLIDQSVGDLHISYSKRFEQFQAVAYRLHQRANLAGVTPWIGGTDVQEKLGVDADPSRVGPAVRVDGMDYASGANQMLDRSGENDPSSGP